MANVLMPDVIWDSYRAVTPALCRERGIRVILTDLDNTLAPYEQPHPDEEIRAWVAALSAAGVRIAILSNNHGERVRLFSAELGIPYYPDAHKPGVKVARRAMAELGGTETDTAFLGDQIFTDVWTGRRMRCACVFMVPPIRDKKTLFFRAKRFLERPVIKAYYKRRGRRVAHIGAWPCAEEALFEAKK